MDKISCKESQKFTWSREATKILIELYEGFPCLYQVTSKDYHNKNKRNAAFESITVEFNRRNLTTLNLKAIQEKIHGFRTQILSEVNKINKSKVSGAGADQIYKPKLWCYDLLQFIPKGSPVTQGESNLGISESFTQSLFTHETEIVGVHPEIVYEGDIEGVDSVILSPMQSNVNSDEDGESSRGTSRVRSSSRLSENLQKKRKRSVSKEKSDKIQTLMETATATLRDLRNEQPEPNSNVLFSQYIAAELNTIKDEEILDDVKQQIMAVVQNGKKANREKKLINNC